MRVVREVHHRRGAPADDGRRCSSRSSSTTRSSRSRRIRDVGPGGHFFGTAHTLERYETAFYAPVLSDWRNFETWSEDGALDATQRANRIFKQLLERYEPPPLDDAIREELRAFVARRKEEGGAPIN